MSSVMSVVSSFENSTSGIAVGIVKWAIVFGTAAGVCTPLVILYRNKAIIISACIKAGNNDEASRRAKMTRLKVSIVKRYLIKPITKSPSRRHTHHVTQALS